MVAFSRPSSFVLPNICEITGTVFELKENPLHEKAKFAALKWFEGIEVYDRKRAEKFFNAGRFDIFAALSFPDADLEHLTTCLAFVLWAFSTDDLSDEGEYQSKPEKVQKGHDISCSILHDDFAPRPRYPYAGMLWDLLRRLQLNRKPGMYERFKQAFLNWSSSQVQQSMNRNLNRIPPVDEFILMRRCTVGAPLVEAMVEYSLDLDIPAFVWKHPIIVGMSEATSDIMTWPNDLCSFNKEQSDGDYQNLVCVLQHAHNIDLQAAVDLTTMMISDRVQDYVKLKQSLPSFGPDVDPAVQMYVLGLEHFVQGCVVWHYSSPRYFPDVDPRGKPEVVIHLLPQPSSSNPFQTPQLESRAVLRGSAHIFFYKAMLALFVAYVAVKVYEMIAI